MYLEDKPCGEDLFGSSSHDRLSNSIMNVILKDRGKIDIIGLEGDWGSGKSNIIEIMDKKMKKSHHFFLYDAWGHQEDLPRRTFLEEFTDELINEEVLVEKSKWKDNLKSLLSRKTEKTSKTVPKLNIWYVYIVLIVFVNSLTKNVTYEAIESISPPFIVDFLKESIGNLYIKSLIINIVRNTPIVGSFIIFVIAKFVESRKDKSKTFFECISSNVAELLQIHRNEDIESTIETITSTKEPSVKEFEKWMRQLDKALNKKVVVVFDNMDRLPSEKAKNLWSSIHTFFSECHYDNIRVIVPFDRTQIRKIFVDNESSIDNQEADKFIDKTFSLVFRVSPPVIGDWKKYFRLKFDELEFKCYYEEFIEVRNLYDFNKKQIKPREIILFLNELKLLNEMWENEIPLKYIALFILKKELLLEDPAKVILGNNYIENTGEIFDEEVDKYVAALIFNVSPDIASQVLLEREIENAIKSRDIETFNLIRNASEFEHIFERYLNKLQYLEYGVEVIYQTLFKDEKDAIITKLTITSLENRFLKGNRKITRLDEHIKYLVIMSQNKTNQIIKYVLDSFIQNTPIKGDAYYSFLMDVTSFLNEFQIDFDLKENLAYVELEYEEFFKFLSVSKVQQEEYNIGTPDAIKRILTQMVVQDEYDISKIELLEYVNTSEYDELKEKIEEKIDEDKLDANNVEGVYKFSMSLFDYPLKKWSLASLYRQFNDTFNVENENTHIMAAMVISYMNDEQYNQVVPSNYVNAIKNHLNNNSDTFISGVLNYIYYFTSIGKLLELSTKVRLKAVDDVIFAMIDQEGNRLNIKSVLSLYDKIVDDLGIDGKEFIKFLDGWSDYITDGISTDNIFKVFTTSRFVENLIGFDLEIKDIICNIYNNFYSEKNTDYFIGLFTSEIEAVEFNIYLKLLQEGIISGVTPSMAVAYKESMIIGLKSSQLSSQYHKLHKLLYEMIDKRGLIGTMTDIRDKFINEFDICEADCDFYVPMLFKHARLKSKADDVLRKIVHPLLKKGFAEDIIFQNEKKLVEIANSSEVEKYNLVELLSTKKKQSIIDLIHIDDENYIIEKAI